MTSIYRCWSTYPYHAFSVNTDVVLCWIEGLVVLFLYTWKILSWSIWFLRNFSWHLLQSCFQSIIFILGMFGFINNWIFIFIIQISFCALVRILNILLNCVVKLQRYHGSNWTNIAISPCMPLRFNFNWLENISIWVYFLYILFLIHLNCICLTLNLVSTYIFHWILLIIWIVQLVMIIFTQIRFRKYFLHLVRTSSLWSFFRCFFRICIFCFCADFIMLFILLLGFRHFIN